MVKNNLASGFNANWKNMRPSDCIISPTISGWKKKTSKKSTSWNAYVITSLTLQSLAPFVATGNLGSQQPKPEPLWRWHPGARGGSIHGCQLQQAFLTLVNLSIFICMAKLRTRGSLASQVYARTRDASEIRKKTHSPVGGRLVVEIYRYLQGFVDPWWIRISEPSTILPTQTMHLW